jgi:hypothetical protein
MTDNSEIQWPDWETLQATWDRFHAGEVARNEERLMVYVEVEPHNGLSVGRQHTPRGGQFRLIYKSDLPSVEAMVPTKEDRQRWRMAQEMFDAEFAKHLKDCGGDEKVARETIGVSVQRFYNALPGGHTGKPVKKLVVHPTPVPPPSNPQSEKAKANSDLMAMIEALATAIRKPEGKSTAK